MKSFSSFLFYMIGFVLFLQLIDESRKADVAQFTPEEKVELFVGEKEASVVLTEFFDFSCFYCRKIVPNIAEIIEDNPDIKVVFQPTAVIGPFSKYAAYAVFAANEQGKFWEMYQTLLMKVLQLNKRNIDKAAADIGLDMEKYYADVKSEKYRGNLRYAAQLAGEMHIRGLPALLINKRPLAGRSKQAIQAAIDEEKQALHDIYGISSATDEIDAMSALQSMGDK